MTEKASEIDPKLSDRESKAIVGPFALSFLLGITLLTLLIYFANFWNVAANTRVLDLVIDAGIIQYNDMNAGFVEGVADLKYYLMAQDPVNGTLVLIVMGIFLLFWLLKALEFHHILKFCGAKGSLGQNFQAFFYGSTYSGFFPFHLGDTVTTSFLEERGVKKHEATSALFIFRFFIVFSIAVFALIGLAYVGWMSWFGQLFWAVVIFLAAYFVLRTSHSKQNYLAGITAAAKSLAQSPWTATHIGLLSLFTFALEDIAAYFAAMAFTSEHVILNVDFSVLLMAIVASYIARLIPLTPGGIGQFEWGFAAALYVGGVGFPEAATIALLDNFFRYAVLLLIFAGSNFWSNSHSYFRQGLAFLCKNSSSGGKKSGSSGLIPTAHLPSLPNVHNTLFRVTILASIALAFFFFDEFTGLLLDLWLLESLSLGFVFWTNFKMGALLFGLAFTLFFGAIFLPSYLYKVKNKKFPLLLASVAGVLGGYFLCLEYQTYLLFQHGQSFGEVDPALGYDIGFYTFSLPALKMTLSVLSWGFALSLLTSIFLAASDKEVKTFFKINPIAQFVGKVSTPYSLVMLSLLGIGWAGEKWLSRFDLLLKDNGESAIYNGADYLDVTGFFSHLSAVNITTLVLLATVIVNVIVLRSLHNASVAQKVDQLKPRLKLAAYWTIVLLLTDIGFKTAVELRDRLAVKPNEPVIQLDFIKNHIQATRKAYGIDKVEEVSFSPRQKGDPLPNLNKILNDPSVRNAPLWPGHVSYLERVLDPQHGLRILQTKGDKMVYGPTMEIMRQQQKLRTYYNFLSVDNVRYHIDGETRMFVSSVREVPLIEPVPWLAWWGQRFVLFTHGHGIVMIPSAETNSAGEPNYVSSGIPSQAKWPEITANNQRIYYGEGVTTMAFSNIKNLKEFDYPTEQGRAEFTYPQDVSAGVRVDSFLKRIAFGWKSNQFFDMVFSGLIDPGTRIHYHRTPIERLERIASFLYFDTNPYAVVANGEIVWLTNAMTTSSRYPYSKQEWLGDKSDERAFKAKPHRLINYIEDSVKTTMNAYTGEVKFYKISDAPIVSSWAKIYPGLFHDKETMPAPVQEQLTYPTQLFHIQFDDIFNIYHMQDPVTFFNMEDMWDDGDEVLGPILDHGDAITFSIEPYQSILKTGEVLPSAKKEAQFVLSALFTPENSLNIRAIPMAYQDGEDYGRLVVAQVPKGYYSIGPEQADAVIDQNPKISQQISWWNRRGTEVIRGHTTLLIVEKEAIYVEPIFLRSQQNPITQLKRVIVVFRGKAYMAENLEEALREAYADQATN